MPILYAKMVLLPERYALSLHHSESVVGVGKRLCTRTCAGFRRLPRGTRPPTCLWSGRFRKQEQRWCLSYHKKKQNYGGNGKARGGWVDVVISRRSYAHCLAIVQLGTHTAQNQTMQEKPRRQRHNKQISEELYNSNSATNTARMHGEVGG